MKWVLIAAMCAFVTSGQTGLPPLPRAVGGQCAGTTDGMLLVIGGSYFPKPLFEGGTKTWVKTIYVLKPGASEWQTQYFPRAIAYAACVSADKGMVIAGGGDSKQNFADVWWFTSVDGKLSGVPLPRLPVALANAGAALANDVVYVAGGQESPTATTGSRSLYALDLKRIKHGWKKLDDCPGPGRILPVFGAIGDDLYLASGAELTRDGRVYLRDAWRYTPGAGWTRMPDAPRATVAAPVLARNNSLYIFGGDDGANAGRIQELKDKHPGFSREITAWTPSANRWSKVGDYAPGLVTTMAAEWGGQVVIPGGEDRPGHRSAEVFLWRAAELMGDRLDR